MIDLDELRLAVLGRPIAHSKSPAIQSAAYELLELPWDYSAIECGEAELGGFLASRGPEWRGFSLTMPLKEEAHRLSRFVDTVAAESGVVNTLLRLAEDPSEGGAGAPQWAGYNTDVAGMASAIARAGLDPSDAVVIGSGATAVSAIMAVRRLGATQVTLLARNAAAAAALVARFDDTSEPTGGGAAPRHSATISVSAATFEEAVDPANTSIADRLREASLVISTLPGSAATGLTLPVGIESVPLFDVAYDPWPSPLAERWTEAGGEARAGLEMLVEQAIVQIRIFLTGDPRTPLPHEEEVRATMTAASGSSNGVPSSPSSDPSSGPSSTAASVGG